MLTDLVIKFFYTGKSLLQLCVLRLLIHELILIGNKTVKVVDNYATMSKYNYSKFSEYEKPLKYSSVLFIIDKTIDNRLT